jgi:hypothetical protein
MTVRVEFSDDEALVLFEWLSRHDDPQALEFEDQAEQRVLWNLLGHLESALDATLSRDYQERLAKARTEVRDDVD